MKTITTKTPIGDFVVFIKPIIVQVVEETLISRAIIYPAEIIDLHGDKGRIQKGYSFTTHIPESLLDKITGIDNLLISKDKLIYRDDDGNRIWI